MTWIYRGEPFTQEKADTKDFIDFTGFIYIIVNKSSGKKYLGKKLLRSRRSFPPLKGKKRRRIIIKNSNWEKYWSSSHYIAEALKEEGKDNFERIIVKFYKTKSALNYAETCALVQCDVLHAITDDAREYYNENIERVYYHKNTEPAEDLLDEIKSIFKE